MDDFAHILRTTFAARKFTREEVTDEDVREILDLARFASSGGNAQPWRVIAVRDEATKRAIIDAGRPSVRRYMAQQAIGERGFASTPPTKVTAADIEALDDEGIAWYLQLAQAPVLLVIGVDLRLVASIDMFLDRVGVVSGASVYPFIQNILLAARARKLSGVLTTFAAGGEPVVQDLLRMPADIAVAAVVPLGHPLRTLTSLRRKPVSDFANWGAFDGPPVGAG